MALFGKKKRSRELPEGWIESGDQILIPEDEVPAELAEEGERGFRILDEWNGDTGPFVGVSATAVREAAESSDDPRAAADEAMNDPMNWVDDDPPDGIQIIVCRIDMSTGKLDVGPAMTDLMLGTAEFQVFDMEGSPSICVHREPVMEEVFQRIEAMDYDITEDEHRALTYEVMDEPRHWTGGVGDEEPDYAGEEEPTYSFFPFDYTTGRIDRREGR